MTLLWVPLGVGLEKRALKKLKGFIEIAFIYCTIHPFAVYALGIFSIVTELYNHQHTQFYNIFIIP